MSGDKASKMEAHGQSATLVTGGMGRGERRPVATTLWRKKQAKDVNRQLNRDANIDGKQANENMLPIICHQRFAS